MSAYRKFSRPVMVAIIRRATGEDGKARCERCGLWVKKRSEYEIDHVLAERMRPEADKCRPLVAADGQLLCTAVCHPEKTGDDVGYIAEAKRREAYHLGIAKPGKKFRRWPPMKRAWRARAAGASEIARRYGMAQEPQG